MTHRTTKTVKPPPKASFSGSKLLSAGLKSPTGCRLHFALVHAGNEEGFLKNAKMQNTADTHDEMEGDCYETYFVEQLFAKPPSEWVIVVHSAHFRSRKDKLPTKS
jgi:hypothetical protein